MLKDTENKVAEMTDQENPEKLLLFGLKEQMGSHKGVISRTAKMSQDEADDRNKKIVCIKWVLVEFPTE